ncbi:uncharacterized protein LOC128184567 [Crassostrea angulata]|uniref:Prokineticin domain-containing protein n=2 Tax=Magallana gigas TaxID=29159 RepID=A0A8W8JCB4_MAGGI|nr:uncharacterized protein LOC105318840 [Crassostrea gigas]XP_052710065.1 uncharacterized protein LOC128184567 [Crassostrea angulata]XP_052710066.1 uncharacterized protein LOC128184567 [Crassostrea angulata]|eukprot:XP_011414433.1 PREDICTED: uncharacterized protein LOC105318840 [Crassostrea gigas]
MYFLTILGLCTLVAALPRVKRQDQYYMENKCSMAARDTSCPTGYCCAYDEFFRIIYYCKKLGAINESCSTVASDADCPCEPGLTCVPTVQGSSFVTIYGRCKPVGMTTEEAGTTEAEHTNHGHHVTKHG